MSGKVIARADEIVKENEELQLLEGKMETMKATYEAAKSAWLAADQQQSADTTDRFQVYNEASDAYTAAHQIYSDCLKEVKTNAFLQASQEADALSSDE